MIIGNDVWIGADSVILSGVTGVAIEDGAVVGTRSVVVQDLPPYAIAFGNPSKSLRYRFSQEIINELLELAWWDWSDEKIREFLPDLLNSVISAFISGARLSKL